VICEFARFSESCRAGGRYDSAMQTRYLILAALITGIAIIAAAALWFALL
jgi:hypothetical protein